MCQFHSPANGTGFPAFPSLFFFPHSDFPHSISFFLVSSCTTKLYLSLFSCFVVCYIYRTVMPCSPMLVVKFFCEAVTSVHGSHISHFVPALFLGREEFHSPFLLVNWYERILRKMCLKSEKLTR